MHAMLKERANHAIWVAAAMMVIAIWGCAPSAKYGRLEPDDRIKQTFLAKEILPDHSYYWVGGQNNPRVIIGIQAQYTLKSDIWKPIDLTPEQLRIWIDRSGARDQKDLTRNGSVILDEQGNNLGIWFANRNWRDYSRVERLEDNVIVISAPIDDSQKGRYTGCVK